MWLADQPFRPLGRKAVADVEHPGWAQPNQLGNFPVGHPVLAQFDDLPPALLLGRDRQLASISSTMRRPSGKWKYSHTAWLITSARKRWPA
jgi:hypothetical protein